jgi:NADPH-dependent ferric siderophore reductase
MTYLMTQSGADHSVASRVLVAGDETILPVIRELVTKLPRSIRGQIFIEVASADDIDPLETPERVTVTWLTRDSRFGEPGNGTGCVRGYAVSRAVAAWISEMTTGDVDVDAAELCVWLGGAAALEADLSHDVESRLGSARETIAH